MDDLTRLLLPPPLRAKFPSVSDLIAFYDSCDDDAEEIAARIKSRSVSELHILGRVSSWSLNGFPTPYALVGLEKFPAVWQLE